MSFLIDRRGVIRYVHPGPAFHREVVLGDVQPRRDFVELDRMIDRVLDEPELREAVQRKRALEHFSEVDVRISSTS